MHSVKRQDDPTAPAFVTDSCFPMPSPTSPDAGSDDSRPWPQKLYDSIWLLAGAAFVFFVLSYVVWGLVDILTVPTG